MSKPPKRSSNGKKPPHNGGRRNERSSENPGEHIDKSSKRGSFRKAEAEKRGKKYVPASVRGRDEKRKPESREPRSQDRRFPEPKSARLKADLFGIHAVREAWQNPARFVHALYVTENALKEAEEWLKTAAKRPAPQIVSKDDLDRAFAPGTVHQGIALSCQPLAEQSVMDLVIKGTAKDKSVIVILDQVTDPHNIGAIMRSACAFGADGIVMQTRHVPEMTGILAKTACGAADHLPIAYETNLSRAIEKLKENHYTVIGLDEHSPKTFAALPKYERAVIVLGAEGPGMRRLIKEHCDVLVTLPTQKPINSLNVSNAAAVALYALTA
ncbi:MAG: 23S rRNA (guanosine(2251)-2'-O)-methyltransferase RlmB [Micavibrio aeruginosavorus]|uniref:23S rRNA (Guanosine(2251)-2'-O)-methyltransferase RlmB n=1 Tax=Micavibrio aeruginosavorus TaxID=349221 RepID=A0A2W5Q3F5_9BACT|nr:MAG: 23S rRNA (guanosine(2251)-2'-O)-methyltransferase RlmB [Micavibrio aeruginosavorus]